MEQLLLLLKNYMPIPVVLFFIGGGILFLFLYDWNPVSRKLKSSPAIPKNEFLENWDEYRKNDTSGCYVITIYRRKPLRSTANKTNRYNDVYVGQSVNIYKRVFNHLTGHGNGDVYADVKYGCHVYVKFVPCPAEQLNKYEKWLINHFDATTSYNRTKGGAKVTAR